MCRLTRIYCWCSNHAEDFQCQLDADDDFVEEPP